MDAQIERFKTALGIDTSWPENGSPDNAEGKRAEGELTAFQDFLARSFPLFHRTAERTVPGPYGLLYRWTAAAAAGVDGAAKPTQRRTADIGGQAEPVLFLAHYDVVPAERDQWTVDPFGGIVQDGFLYGRGAVDTKNTLMGLMEAAEALVASGFEPTRDIWFAFGGDEERSGKKGAQYMAAWFAEQGIHFSWALDEGSIVADGMIGGIRSPLALIGVEEKGFLDIELSVRQKPGHASRPPRVQAVELLARSLCRIARRPFPFALTPAVEAFFSGLAELTRAEQPGAMGRVRAFVMSRARAFGPLFFAFSGGSPETSSMMRTTVAMTQLFGSPADNVLPSQVRAILNLRLLPGWTIAQAVEHVRRAVRDDRVLVRPSPYRDANDPLPTSLRAARGEEAGWTELKAAAESIFPEAAVLPFLVTATTDSRHYGALCGQLYRFGPVSLTKDELDRVHGHDERISLANYSQGIAFFTRLIEAL